MNIFSQNFKTLLILPLMLTIAAIAATVMWGLRPGIDVAGGSLLEMNYTAARPTMDQVQTAVAPLNFGEVRIQPTGNNGVLLRLKALSNDEKNSLETALQSIGSSTEVSFNSVGPTIGADILHKGMVAVVIVLLSLIAFIAFAFRSINEPVASWKYGVVAIITLAHDVLVPVGLFAALGHFKDVEIGSLFIVAMLTILGVSINNTIVIFDRVRENLRRSEARKQGNFAEVVGRSVAQTLARSINTSVAVIIVLASLWLVGPVATKDFSLALLTGMIVGTYSSICLASPLIVLWERYTNAGKEETVKKGGKK